MCAGCSTLAQFGCGRCPAWQNGDGFPLLSFFEVLLQGWQAAPSPAEVWGGGRGVGGKDCFIKRSRNHKENLSAAVGSSITNHQVQRSVGPYLVPLSISSMYYLRPVCTFSLPPLQPIPRSDRQTKKVTAMPQTTLFFLFSCGSFVRFAVSHFPIFSNYWEKFSHFKFVRWQLFHLPFLAHSLSPSHSHSTLRLPLLACVFLVSACCLKFGIFTKFLH